MSDERLYGCMDAGGTKFVLGVADECGSVLRAATIPTGTPTKTIEAALALSGHLPLPRLLPRRPGKRPRNSGSVGELLVRNCARLSGHGVIAFYLAQLVVAQQALLSPRHIIFGGGLRSTPNLLEHLGVQRQLLAGSYFGARDYAQVIVAPLLGEQVGLPGALALALEASS